MTKGSLKIFLQAVILIAVFAAAFYLAGIARESDAVRELVFDYGYLGVLALALISGFNLAVPVPAIAFTPLFLESGLNFWIVVGVITVGVTLADSFTYIVGRWGRRALPPEKNIKIITALERAGERHVWAPMTLLFLFASFIPLPNELLVVPLGFLNYKFSRIWPVLLSGNLVFNLIYSAGIVGLFNFYFLRICFLIAPN